MARSSVTGDRQLVAALKQLASGIPLGDVDKSAAEAMQPMLDEVIAGYKLHRQDQSNRYFAEWGKLTRNGQHVDQAVAVRRTEGTKTHRQYKLGGLRRARKLLHLIEFGTAPHYQPKRKIFHPGARPNPIMVPAFEAHKDAVIARMGAALWARLSARATETGRKNTRNRRR